MDPMISRSLATVSYTHLDVYKRQLELPEGTVDASVHSVREDGDDYRVIFYLNVYYEACCESRAVDMLSLIHICCGSWERW